MNINLEQERVLHIARYNNRIAKLLSTKCYDWTDVLNKKVTVEEYKQSIEQKKQNYLDALECMANKEDLLELNDPSFFIEDDTNKPEDKKYDVSKLTFEESLELEQLLVKAMIGSDEVQGVKEAILAPELSEEVIARDVEAEPNVAKIKHEETPMLSHVSTVTHSDPVAKLKATLAKTAAEQFRNAGGNLDEDEQRLLNDE